jgi:hypothetical protein
MTKRGRANSQPEGTFPWVSYSVNNNNKHINDQMTQQQTPISYLISVPDPEKKGAQNHSYGILL